MVLKSGHPATTARMNSVGARNIQADRTRSERNCENRLVARTFDPRGWETAASVMREIPASGGDGGWHLEDSSGGARRCRFDLSPAVALERRQFCLEKLKVFRSC